MYRGGFYRGGPIALSAISGIEQALWDIGNVYLDKAFEINNGYIDIPMGPGLGISVNEEALKEMAYDGEWESPLFKNTRDGSMIDW